MFEMSGALAGVAQTDFAGAIAVGRLDVSALLRR